MRALSWFLVAAAAVVGGGIRASADDLAEDIARIHIEAIGGRERVERLRSFRAAGESSVGDVQLEFQMWAQRPRSIRVEVMMGNQRLIQGWNGENEPWIQAGPEGPVQPMPSHVSERFKSESEFDTPLFLPRQRGFALEYAGEAEVGGRPVVRLLATRDLTDQSTLYLAADTYFIVRQDRVRYASEGVRVETQTSYGDFRPVLGVILPHRIIVREAERIISDVVLSWIEPNPPMESALFTTPAAASARGVENLKAPPAAEQEQRILELAQ